MTAKRRSVLRLALLLGIVALASAVFHIRSIEQIFPRWFGEQRAEWPLLIEAEGGPHFVVDYLQSNAAAAGLRRGDRLIAINAVPISSRSVFADLLSHSEAGSSWDVQYQRQSQPGDRHAHLLLQQATTDNDPLLILFFLALPAFCVALGLWVVTLRLHDVRAWLLLFFLLSAGTMFDSFPYLWGPNLRLFGSVYRHLIDSGGVGCLFLLGIYFPEPFPPSVRRPWWTWPAGTLLALWAAFVFSDTLTFVIELYSLRAAVPFHEFLSRLPFSNQPLYVAMSIGFLACLVSKYRIASSQDARRRLRALLLGSSLGLLPIATLFTAQRVEGGRDDLFPIWIKVPVYISFAALPLTLAYVIVVQRALDIRVVIRQGLQYTLASRGIVLLQALLSLAMFALCWRLVVSASVSPPVLALTIVAGVCGLLLLQGGRKRLALWIDRKFFRDAYDSEQILNDLSDQVRTIVEVKPLIEVVAERIAASLHIRQIAVLLREHESYRPCHAIGFDGLPAVDFPSDAATVQLLRDHKQPTRVYADDLDSWLNHSGLRDEERHQIAWLRPELLVPLAVKDELIGFMSLGQKLSEAPFSSSDLRLLRSVATQTGLALEVARLTTAIGQEIASRERLNRELEIARDVQEHLFPQHLPAIQRLEYGACCRPAREVGGDYYDFLELPGGKLGFAIGDVSGKGIGAALLMASLCASLRGQASIAENLSQLMARVNNLVFEASSMNRYATFFYSEFDPATLRLSFVNAGHNPPVILRPFEGDWQLFRLEAGGPPVGLLAKMQYQDGTFALQPGDRIVLFTDGISESMNREDEEWGEENLIAVAQYTSATAEAAVQCIMSAAQSFAAGAPQHDDMTVVLLHVLAPELTDA